MSAAKAGIIGRSLRLLSGIYVMIVALPVWFEAGWRYNLRSLGIAVVLLLFYTFLHVIISRFVPDLHRWFGARTFMNGTGRT